MATKKKKLTRLQQALLKLESEHTARRHDKETLQIAMEDRNAMRRQLDEMVGLRDSWSRRYENEKIARECSERQNTILSEIQKDYVRLSEEMGEVGVLMQQHYSDEMSRNEHQGQTLAQVLWRYLKVERANRDLIRILLDTDAIMTPLADQRLTQNKLKPWLARVVRWFA